MKTITINALTTDVIGSFRIPINTDQTEGISILLEMREHLGVPRPFHGEFVNDPIEEGFLYIWSKKNVITLYLAKKFEPNMFQHLFGKHPKVQIWTCSISPSKRDFTLAQITDLLDQHP